MQLQLFKPPRHRKQSTGSLIRWRIESPAGNKPNTQKLDEQSVSSSSKNFAELISQLEESKFLRLFRHLVDSDLPNVSDMARPAEPLDLPDAELHFKVWVSIRSLGSFTAAWLFQIAHAPAFLLPEDLGENFCSERLRAAFVNLAKRWPKMQRAVPHDGPHTCFQAASEGCDYYYLFTNICHDIGDNALERFSNRAHELYSEIVGVPRERHPGFGIGTPETVVNGAHREGREVHKFLIDLLNMPSSYYFVAREGRISVAAVTEHGAFMASPEAGGGASGIGLSTVATSRLAAETAVSSTVIGDLEKLLNACATRERDLQDFLTKNPVFLFALDERYCEIRPHVCLYDAKGERLVPDFMARIQDSNIWDAIELKLPQSPTTVRTRFIERASAAAARGIAELLQYRDFFSSRENRNRVASRFKTAPYEPCLVLIIGRGRHTRRYEWSSIRAGFPKVQIVSYDYVFERAKELRRHLSSPSSNSKTFE